MNILTHASGIPVIVSKFLATEPNKPLAVHYEAHPHIHWLLKLLKLSKWIVVMRPREKTYYIPPNLIVGPIMYDILKTKQHEKADCVYFNYGGKR